VPGATVATGLLQLRDDRLAKIRPRPLSWPLARAAPGTGSSQILGFQQLQRQQEEQHLHPRSKDLLGATCSSFVEPPSGLAAAAAAAARSCQPTMELHCWAHSLKLLMVLQQALHVLRMGDRLLVVPFCATWLVKCMMHVCGWFGACNEFGCNAWSLVVFRSEETPWPHVCILWGYKGATHICL